VIWFGNDQTMPDGQFDDQTARRLLNEYVSVRKYFLGDYYPLTEYNLDEKRWLAWQFDRPDLGEGMVQAFRRGKSPDDTATFQLQGLEPEALYQLTNPDVVGTAEMSGRELQKNGHSIAVKNRPAAVIIRYKKAR
jgi:alpha-galactosidase